MIKSHSKSMAVVSAALALCMAAGGAFAQDRRDDRGPNRFQPQEQQQRQYQQDRNHDGRFDRRDGFRGDRQDYRDGREMDRRGFAQPHAEWRRGGRVPSEYRGRNYVVDNYRQYHLNAPPRGYQWVGVGGDFVLAAVATGIIAQIITGQ